MNYLALSGFGHPLNRYLDPNRVTCLNAPTWGRASWSRRHAMRVAESITEPTVLIGFSAGATAAVEIACVNEHVERVYAHSPLLRARQECLPEASFHLYRTIGDTTPTCEGTLETYLWLAKMQWPDTPMLRDLDPVAPEPIRDPATWTMARRGHQFRNCLPYLPQEILR